jgi:hypothetical protein
MMSTTRRTSQVMTLLVTCFGLFMVLLDASIVNVALPTIQTDLRANLSDLQWVIDAYTLPLAALMLTAGTLGDRFGRKRLFLAGLVLFVLGSLLCGFAPAFGWLLFGRAVQGVGAAALLPGSLSVLVAAYPEPRARAGHWHLGWRVWRGPGRRAARGRSADPAFELACDLFRQCASWGVGARPGVATAIRVAQPESPGHRPAGPGAGDGLPRLFDHGPD